MSQRLFLMASVLAALGTAALAAGNSSVAPTDYLLWGFAFALSYVASKMAERVGQAGVVGSLIASVAAAVIPLFVDGFTLPDLALISTIGMAILLFEAGLESDVEEMFKVGPKAALVAVVGVVLLTLGGYFFATAYMGLTSIPEIGTYVVALTATSVGISLKVLEQMGMTKSPEAKIIIAAAVLDDILGMAGLAALSGIAATGTASAMGMVTPVAVGLLFIAIFAAISLSISAALGIAVIIVTFVVGFITEADHDLEETVKGIGKVLYAPAFFAVGALMVWDVMSFSMVLPVLVLSAIAVITKFVAGFVLSSNMNRALVGAAMSSRGEVGLAVVVLALSNHWISDESFAILTGTIILVTVLAPFMMKATVAQTDFYARPKRAAKSIIGRLTGRP